MILKVCGMRDSENIRSVESLMQHMEDEPSFRLKEIQCLMGFIFYGKSPRFVSEKPYYLPENVARTGVFVNETTEEIRRIISLYGLAYVQLHGKESPSQCAELRREIKVIKAFSVADRDDIRKVEPYEECADLYLFDTKCEGHGGSGTQFDWSVLEAYRSKTPFLLSGGIGPESSAALKNFSHPMLAGYDLNSKFECAPGMKEVTALRNFFTALRTE